MALLSMRDSDSWHHVEAVFAEAADLAPAGQRAYLDRACRRSDGTVDVDLREEVESLLAHDLAAEGFFGAVRDRLAAVAEDVAGGSSDRAADVPPERVGPWRLGGVLGRGGMSTVYRAERDDGRFEQTAAIKLVRPGLASRLVDRFRDERQILARLEHPAIARLIDGGQTGDGQPYLVMEYVDGEPITHYCDRRRLPIRARIALFQDVCGAVQFAHGHLVIHRDLKPSNVLVAESEAGPRVKLLDFGIAKLLTEDASSAASSADHRMMTPEYAAPEQLLGEPATTATDIYGLGVLLHELLTGSRPSHLGGRVSRAMDLAPPKEASAAIPDDDEAAAARSTDPARLRRYLRGDLDAILLRALHLDPEQRYAGASALAADLTRHLDGIPVEARPESTAYRAGRFVRRHRVAVAAAAAVFLAIVVGAGAALWQAQRAGAEAARAEAEAATAERVTALLVEVFGASDPHVARGDTLSAFDLLAQGAARVEALGDEPVVQARLLHVLANVYGNLGDGRRAAAMLRRAIEIQRTLPAAPPGELTLMLSDLGVALYLLGDGPHALAAIREALARHEAGGIADSARYANSLNDLCLALTQAEPASAEAACRHSLAVDRALGPPSESTAFRYNNLGLALEHQGTFADAVLAFRQAITIRASVADPDPVEAAYTEGNLARVLAQIGTTGEGETVARRAVGRMRGAVGREHPAYALTLTDLGRVLEASGRYDEALGNYREALAVQQATVGPDHPFAITTLNNIGVTEARAGRDERAVPLLREALERRRRAQGDAHPEVATGLTNLATLASRRGRWAEAATLYEQAGVLLAATRTPNRATVATILYKLGLAYAGLGRTAEAETAVRQALRTFEDVYPRDHIMIANALLETARLSIRRGAPADARALLDRARPIFEASDAPDARQRLGELEALARSR